MRDFFDKELKAALRDHGIDLRDRALTIAAARDALYQQEKHERQTEEFIARVEQFSTDNKLRSRYFDQVNDQIQ